MLESLARVVETRPGSAVVEVLGNAGCGQCTAGRTCSSAVLTRVFPLRSRRFTVHDALGVGIGDEIVVAVDDGALYRSSLCVYALALGGVLAGAMLGAWLAPGAGDGASALGAALGLASAFLITRRVAAAPRFARIAVPRVVRAGGRAAVSFDR